MIQTIIVITWTILSSIIFGLAVIITSVFTKSGTTPHKVAQIWARTILMVSRIHVTVKGFSNIDHSRSYVYMSNHQSNFDIPVLLAFLKVQFRWLAKAELFTIPIFGHAMKRVGYISIDRSNRKSAFESLNRAAETIRNGVSVLIFPEGTRSRDGSIGTFKKGGFVMAIEAGVPIIPIIIHGTRAIMPKTQLRIQTGNVVLEIQKPIETTHFRRKNKEELMETVRKVICDSFEKGINT